MNEERILDLLEKVYTEFGRKFDAVEQELRGVRQELKETKQDVKKLNAKIDGEISDKIRALFDDRQVVHEKFDEINEKIDRLQMDVNNLTVKTIYHDNRIIELGKKLGIK